MLVIAHPTTISQMTARHSHTWPLNFAAWTLNRLKISLIGMMGWGRQGSFSRDVTLFQKHGKWFGKANFQKGPTPGDARWSPRRERPAALSVARLPRRLLRRLGSSPETPKARCLGVRQQSGMREPLPAAPADPRPVSSPTLTTARFRPVTAHRGAIPPRGIFGQPVDLFGKAGFFDLCRSLHGPFATRQI